MLVQPVIKLASTGLREQFFSDFLIVAKDAEERRFVFLKPQCSVCLLALAKASARETVGKLCVLNRICLIVEACKCLFVQSEFDNIIRIDSETFLDCVWYVLLQLMYPVKLS